MTWMTSDCMCIVDGCAGTGFANCAGCGGDLCICVCGGDGDCPGCDRCEPRLASDNYETAQAPGTPPEEKR